MSRLGAFLVTGAGSGIGQAITLKILSEGHYVFGLGRDPRKLEATQRLATDHASRFASAAVDLSRANETSKVTQEIRRWLASHRLPLLGLVNNAGVFDRLSFLESSDALWQRQFENNILSAVRITRDLFEELRDAAPSSVLNISSTLGLRPVADTSAYSAMKAAMVNWTQTLALEWAPARIRVNCICPGLVDTPIHGFHGEQDSSTARQQAHAAQPLGRLGKPGDIAAAAWFLLDAESSAWTTGAVLNVDGGISL